MALDCGITHRLKAAQMEMFRLAKAKHGWSQEAIHHASGIDRTSVGQYARGETAMSGPAIMALASVDDFPAELLTMLFAGTSRYVGNSGDTGDLDQLGCETADYTAEYVNARRDGKIDETEAAKLKSKARRLAVVASKAA